MGLKDEIQGFVVALSPPEYATTVRAVALIDNDSASGFQVPCRPRSSSGQKRKFDNTSSDCTDFSVLLVIRTRLKFKESNLTDNISLIMKSQYTGLVGNVIR